MIFKYYRQLKASCVKYPSQNDLLRSTFDAQKKQVCLMQVLHNIVFRDMVYLMRHSDILLYYLSGETDIATPGQPHYAVGSTA